MVYFHMHNFCKNDFLLILIRIMADTSNKEESVQSLYLVYGYVPASVRCAKSKNRNRFQVVVKAAEKILLLSGFDLVKVHLFF